MPINIEINERQRGILKEALINYITARVGPEAIWILLIGNYEESEHLAELYVDKRYATQDTFFKSRKIKEVALNFEAARDLRRMLSE